MIGDPHPTHFDTQDIRDETSQQSPGRCATMTVSTGLSIREYTDDLQPEFEAITSEWMSEIGRLGQSDLDVLANPRSAILDRGGSILFVEAADAGMIGTGALLGTGEAVFELARFGIRKRARRRGW